MSKAENNTQISNSNRWNTRTIVTIALLAAISAALSFIEIPFIAVGFLKYDASNVPALIAGFVFGPAPGFLTGTIGAVIHAIFSGNWPGCLMNVCAVAAHVIPAALIYKKRKTIASAIVGLIIGAILATAVMAVMNIIIDPIFYGYTTEAILELILPIFIPFNLMKTAINSVLGILIFKPVQMLVFPKSKDAGTVVTSDLDEDVIESEDL